MLSAREMERVEFSEDVPSSYHVPGPVLVAWGWDEGDLLNFYSFKFCTMCFLLKTHKVQKEELKYKWE